MSKLGFESSTDIESFGDFSVDELFRSDSTEYFGCSVDAYLDQIPQPASSGSALFREKSPEMEIQPVPVCEFSTPGGSTRENVTSVIPLVDFDHYGEVLIEIWTASSGFPLLVLLLKKPSVISNFFKFQLPVIDGPQQANCRFGYPENCDHALSGGVVERLNYHLPINLHDLMGLISVRLKSGNTIRDLSLLQLATDNFFQDHKSWPYLNSSFPRNLNIFRGDIRFSENLEQQDLSRTQSTRSIALEFFEVGEEITSETMKIKEVQHITSISLKMQQEMVKSTSMTVKASHTRKNIVKFAWRISSGIEELSREVGKRFKLEVGRFDIKYKDEDGDWIILSCNEDLKLHVETLRASHQCILKLSVVDVIREINTIDEQIITLKTINQYRGYTTQEEAAKELGVSLSTFKRRCKEFGVTKWPKTKRKKLQLQESENDEMDRGKSTIAVMATYNEVTIRFPLCCNSGIEELRKKLDDTFKFGAEEVRIMSKYEDRWINLFSDDQLQFHIRSLNTSGQSTMEVSVCLVGFGFDLPIGEGLEFPINAVSDE